MNLRYRINEQFRLRTETPTAQSIDFVYDLNTDEDAAGESADAFAERSGSATDDGTDVSPLTNRR